MNIPNKGTLRYGVLEQLNKNPCGLTIKEIALLCECTEGSASGTLHALWKKKLVKIIGVYPLKYASVIQLNVPVDQKIVATEFKPSISEVVKSLKKEIKELDILREKKVTALEVILEYSQVGIA